MSKSGPVPFEGPLKKGAVFVGDPKRDPHLENYRLSFSLMVPVEFRANVSRAWGVESILEVRASLAQVTAFAIPTSKVVGMPNCFETKFLKPKPGAII